MYRYVPEKEEPEYSERIKQIIQAHEDVGLEWIPNDKDSETLREISFIRFSKRNPGAAKQELLAVYREKDEITGDEWMLWKVKYTCLDKDDRNFEAEVWLGKKPRLETDVQRDPESGNIVNKTIRRWNMQYTQPWDVKVFDRLLKEYNSGRTYFYLSSTSDDFFQNFGGTSIMIKRPDLEKYRTMSYEDLVAYDELLRTKEINKEAAKKIALSNRQG